MKNEKLFQRRLLVMSSRVLLKQELERRWSGDHNRWPVSWDDIHPSVDSWVDQHFPDGAASNAEMRASVIKMVGYVEECVSILTNEGAL